MAKDNAVSRQQMRARIAHLAARLIAEDGISDYGLAKRKAARQAGAPDSRNLPNNLEIEQALHAYQQLYQAEKHPQRLYDMRSLALDMMHMLNDFHPHLTGSVLSGMIGRHADVHLILFTDDHKGLEMFLSNQGLSSKARDTQIWIGEMPMQLPGLVIPTTETDFIVTVVPTRYRHQPLRLSPDGRAVERASIDAVDNLITQYETSETTG